MVKDKSNIFINVIAWLTIFIATSIAYYTIIQILRIEIVFLGVNSISKYINIDSFNNFSFSSVQFCMRIIMYGVISVCTIALFSGIGLLRYKNWARISFTIMSVIAALIILSGVALYWYFVSKYLNLITTYLLNKLLDFFYKDILIYKITLIAMLSCFVWIAYKLNFTHLKYKFINKASIKNKIDNEI